MVTRVFVQRTGRVVYSPARLAACAHSTRAEIEVCVSTAPTAYCRCQALIIHYRCSQRCALQFVTGEVFLLLQCAGMLFVTLRVEAASLNHVREVPGGGYATVLL
jgi:hypothetical protein